MALVDVEQMELAWICWPCITARGIHLSRRIHLEEQA